MTEFNRATGEVNLFVVSQIGQARHALGLINQFRLNPNTCVIVPLYTDRNKAFPQLVAGLFQEEPEILIYGLKIPLKPLSHRLLKNKKIIYNLYKEAVGRLVKASNHVNLYLCNVNAHYAFWPRVCDELGLSYRTCMFEEGLSTYKWTMKSIDWDAYGQNRNYGSDYDRKKKAKAWKEVAQAGRGFLDAIKPILLFWLPSVKALGTVLFKILQAIATSLSPVIGCDLNEKGRNVFERLLPSKYRYSVISTVDDGFFCFPEIMATSKRLHFQNMHTLDFSVKKLDYSRIRFENPEEYWKGRDKYQNVPVGTAVFASQKYGTPEIYYRAVFDVLLDMGLSDVYFKFHPKEAAWRNTELFLSICAEYPQIRLWNDPSFDTTPLESMLAEGRLSDVIGLTSSTLFYLPKIEGNHKAISIIDAFRACYTQRYESWRAAIVSDSIEPLAANMRKFEEDVAAFSEVVTNVSQYKMKYNSDAPGSATSITE